jgi:ribosome recycling factor
MAYNFSPLKQKIVETEEWLKKEFSQIRTGRATPIILDAVTVDSYGSQMAIKEMASITIEDPKTIRVVPWDQSQVKAIEKGITDSNLGLSVSTDEKGLRVIFPELTAERRVQLAKVAKQKLEEARVSLRKEREQTRDDIQTKEKKGELSEDDKFRYNEELQKMIDEANRKLDELAARKDKEILE